MNVDGKRFVDEGADFRNYTYAKYGKQILFQPERAAFQLFDQKTLHLLRDEYRIPQVTKGEADTIEGLADQLGIDPEGLAQTVAEYNAACQPGDYNPTVLDGVHTENVEPPKTNWALPLDSPPYEGYAVTCGITFTFGGLRINRRAQVMDTTDNPIPGLYAAGEIVGGLFYHNYAGGAGLMQGSVFGKIAGSSAGEGRGVGRSTPGGASHSHCNSAQGVSLVKGIPGSAAVHGCSLVIPAKASIQVAARPRGGRGRWGQRVPSAHCALPTHVR